MSRAIVSRRWPYRSLRTPVSALPATHSVTVIFRIVVTVDRSVVNRGGLPLRLGDDVDGQPGFTAIGALVALLSIALLARRR
ncbi:PGF-CTERM sorting domain-containing protein [Natronosalvus amylolyticus]|uniref:PGF-CTERM sorting domain-containing protein n=1 Tax=Natronosalvus amylolyticus TaxID=2961994 RepID=UPI003CCCC27C